MEADERVRAAWIHGSIARGDADEASDLDVMTAVVDSELEDFGREWRSRLSAITPTVMARQSFGTNGSWLSITPGALRFDHWVEPVSHVANSSVRDRHVLFDRDQLDKTVPLPLESPRTSIAKLTELRDWASDCLALQPRSRGLLSLECTHTLRWILYMAMVELNRPLPTTGLKQWSRKLTDAQRTVFESLPTDDPDPTRAVLDDLLGPIDVADARPDLGRAFVAPEGYIRGLFLPDLARDEQFQQLSEEFLALHLYLTVILHREDWLLGVEGVYSLRRLLHEFFLAGINRPSTPDALSWEQQLDPSRRAELMSLPTGSATKDAVIHDHQVIKEAFTRVARRELGDQYPTELEQVVEAHVREAAMEP
jgi:hypothetical protein